MESIVEAITSSISNVYNFLKTLNDNLLQWFINLGADIGNWFSDVGSWFSELGSNIGNWFGELGNNLGNWLSYLNPLSDNFFGYKLIELLKDALSYLFIPNQSNVQELRDTVNEKFGFIDSVEKSINDIKNMIDNIENGTSEFKIEIQSKWYTGEVVLFDLSWYAPFKTYGDLLFTGFAYIFFIFRFYKSIPSIINGFSSSSVFINGGGGPN